MSFLRNYLIFTLVLFGLLKFSNTYYIYEKQGDEPTLLKHFKINVNSQDSTDRFPENFSVNFKQSNEIFNIEFTKSSKTYPDVYVTDKDGNAVKYTLNNPEEYEHYVNNDGSAYATLILNKNSEREPFRLIARVISKTKENTTYDIYPVKISERRKRSIGSDNDFHHAISKRQVNHDTVTSGYLNPLDNKDYLIVNKEESLGVKPLKKTSRAGTGPLIFNCETIILSDLSLYEQHKIIANSQDQNYVFGQMRIYFSHLMHSVNQKFQNSFVNDADMRLNIILTNILIITNTTETTWTNPSIVGDVNNPTYLGQDVLVATPTITNFKNYMNSKTFPFQFDHAMALFKKDLWKDGTDDPTVRTNVAGFAYLKGVCDTIKYSVSEDQGGFSSIYTIAHEMGHNFGSVHDGETGATSCPYTDYFIMTPVQNFDKIQNMQKFSTCSIAQFKSALILNGATTTYSSCMTNTPLNVVAEFQNTNYSLAGQLYGADQQCKMKLGQNSTFCQHKANEICSKLWCRKSNDDQYCWSDSPAVEGTTCASGQMCSLGFCTSSPLAPVSVCPYGDGLVMTGSEGITLSTRYVTCSEFLTILTTNSKSEGAFCSSANGQSSCCSTCLKYKYANCTDKYGNCADFKASCPSGSFSGGELVKESCCATCITRPITCASHSFVCLNGGTCSNIASPTTLVGYTCACPSGYSGYNCETKNPCLPNPCKNGGTCTSTGSGCPTCFSCTCIAPFTGTDCSVAAGSTQTSTQNGVSTSPSSQSSSNPPSSPPPPSQSSSSITPPPPSQSSSSITPPPPSQSSSPVPSQSGPSSSPPPPSASSPPPPSQSSSSVSPPPLSGSSSPPPQQSSSVLSSSLPSGSSSPPPQQSGSSSSPPPSSGSSSPPPQQSGSSSSPPPPPGSSSPLVPVVTQQLQLPTLSTESLNSTNSNRTVNNSNRIVYSNSMSLIFLFFAAIFNKLNF